MNEAERTPAASPRRGGATIYDVAKLAGVSHQTVARYLNGATGLKPDTHSRVEFALRELNYRPNYTARALAHGRSQRIAAITHEIDQVGPSQILIGASRAAREAGYLLDVLSFDAGDDAELEVVIEATNMKDTAGILAFASTDHVLARFTSAGFIVPLVVAGETEEARKGGANSINEVGNQLLVDHLQELGHSRFLEIAGPNTWVSARNRSFALETELEKRGLTLTGRIEGDGQPSRDTRQ
ncbi:MAG: LacI family DNA-binding transcriptional regulator [Galbitalea sp.]